MQPAGGDSAESRSRPSRARGPDDPGDAARVLRAGVEVRELIYRIFSSIANGGEPGPADLTTLNARLHEVLGRLQVVLRAGRFSLEWPANEQAIDRMLWPTVRSTGEPLNSADVCGDQPRLDLPVTSRNRDRRWSDMSIWGNRAKKRRHYERRRK